MGAPRIPLAERLERLRRVDPDTGCWIWLGTRQHARGGYGSVSVDGRTRQAHRAVYELLVGPIPDGLVIDHLCRNTGCVNPEHLEPVTTRENILRGTAPPAANARVTHCANGHEFTESNTRVRANGSRFCRTCDRDAKRARRAMSNYQREAA